MTRNICLILAACFALTGCDENARKFAAESQQLLAEYRKKIAAEISESNGFYQRNAAIQTNASWRRLNDALSATQTERSTALAADYEDGRKSPSMVRSELRDYVLLDAGERRKTQAADIDAALPYMENIVKLEADKEKVAALGQMLEVLATPRGLQAERKELEQFVKDTKTSFAKAVCDGLLEKKATAADDDEKDAIEKLLTDKHCSDI